MMDLMSGDWIQYITADTQNFQFNQANFALCWQKRSSVQTNHQAEGYPCEAKVSLGNSDFLPCPHEVRLNNNSRLAVGGRGCLFILALQYTGDLYRIAL